MTHETTHVEIRGLNCPNCAKKVSGAVAALSGVRYAAVEFEAESGTIRYDPSSVSLERIASEVADTGCESNRFTLWVDGRRVQPKEPTADGGTNNRDNRRSDEPTNTDFESESPF